MKRILALILVGVVMLSLCACGKSEAVQNVETAIANIGKIDMFSNDLIVEAEQMYSKLSEKEAKSVENYSELVNARKEYNALVYSTAIAEMEEYNYEKAISLLESIPTYQDAQEKLTEAEDGVFQSMCATYIFNFIKNGGFYNPSAVRVLDAAYGDNTDFYVKMLDADGILYLRIQGTNKLGGTLNKEYVVVIGGSEDGKAYKNDDSSKDYNDTCKTIDVPTINKMLQKYWKDYGLD